MTRETPLRVVEEKCCAGWRSVRPPVASSGKADCQPVCEGGCPGGSCVAPGVCQPPQPLQSESATTTTTNLSPVASLIIIFTLVLSATLVCLVVLILRSDPLYH